MKKGTCQVCLAAHPINKDGRLRRHSHGLYFGEKGCSGYAFKPFEVDCTGVQWVFDAYLQQLALTREQLLAVNLTPELYEPGWYVPKPEENRSEIVRCINVITPGEPGYNRLVDQRRLALNNAIQKYKDALAVMERVIKRFQPFKGFMEDDNAVIYPFETLHHDFYIEPPAEPA
jgi:hypothetical protein